jgi:DNA-directed RNA polymerase specialized sigma24 family protein
MPQKARSDFVTRASLAWNSEEAAETEACPVEVVLRHFHRCRYRSSTTVVLLLEGLRSHEELAIREYGGYEDLRGSGRRSVIPYVHG